MQQNFYVQHEWQEYLSTKQKFFKLQVVGFWNQNKLTLRRGGYLVSQQRKKE
jgi:hypothetical protein